MISVEDWAEIRRLHRAEGMPIKEIARRLGIARNTVRSALRVEAVPRRERGPRAKLADRVEPQIRVLLADWPTMPATVIAERIGWRYSMTTLKDRVRQIRPEYLGVDPVDRMSYEPGELAQCDLWFPATKIPVGPGQERVLPVLVMMLGFSRFLSAMMIPSRQGGDILSGMWALISQIGRVPKTLLWDREAAIGGTGRVSTPAVAFAGTLATQIKLAPPRDPEYKGLVERANGYLETSFLPGRTFASPADFNAQLDQWLVRANTRTVRAVGGRPADLLGTDYLAMLPLPPVAPPIGINHRIRLARDYYVRVDTVDYSVDPRVIGRFVDVTASPEQVVVYCDGTVVARHDRSWAKHAVITDPAHVTTAAALRHQYIDHQRRNRHNTRHHLDGHPVTLRALPDYDALFGVDFTTETTAFTDDTPTGTENTP
ncbi:IS21 family transposase [Mycobacterium sp. WUMAC-067]|uniref:IS21 family transposase n=1 Tax=unclassified Mycobacterium TaxID=2642494 RepID=UPI001CD9B599|nr:MULTISPECIES: IS21 family transposase [unclassified Mycobacterium]MCA2245819.1 IS21 family transposase [Mycobacterium sp. WUMAC-067]MCA2317614.1 IS21 family transposase [Mycobacterium sp. WUMAC-025]